MGSRIRQEFFNEVVVGVFMLAVLALLGYFTIVISGIEVINGKTKEPVAAYFQDVGGLKVRDTVVLRGMNVGSVSDMKLDAEGVRVTLLLQRDLVFREGYRLSVCSGSLLGGNYLLIEEGQGEPVAAGTVLRGEPSSNWMRDLGEVVGKLREATEGDKLKNIVANLEAATDSVKELAARVQEGKGTLGKLFSEDLSLYADLSNTVANLRSITDKVDTGENSLGRLLNDDGNVYTNLSVTMANLKTLSDRLEQGDGTLGRLLSSDDTIYRNLDDTVASLKNVAASLESGEGTLGKLIKDDNKIYKDLDATVSNLKVVTDRLVKGEGTLGKLSADDQLYSDVTGLIKDVRQTVDNFRDTTPISAFASLIVGGL